MTYESYVAYSLTFIQKTPCRDASAHLFSLKYKFYSPVTRLNYVLIADYHEGDVFGIKFYAKMHKRSDYKYSIIINRGDVGNILITCLSLVGILLKDYPAASFGFIGSRSYDPKTKTLEHYKRTQRYTLYCDVVSKTIGPLTFEHFAYDDLSGYLLVNRKNGQAVEFKERLLTQMFASTYENLPDVR